MNDTDPTSIETMYSVASQCLHEKKNKRPDIKKVLIFYIYFKNEGGGVHLFFFLSVHFKLFNAVFFFFLSFFMKGSTAAARLDSFLKLYWNRLLVFV